MGKTATAALMLVFSHVLSVSSAVNARTPNKINPRGKSAALLADYNVLAGQARKEAALTAVKPCSGFDSSNASEVTISPLSYIGTVLTQLKIPDGFDPKKSVSFQVIQSPTDYSGQTQPSIAVNAKNQLHVAVERWYEAVDLGKTYDQPSLIVIRASSGSQACNMYYNLRLFDPFFAFEPDWHADPILHPAYHFAIDCPKPNEALGRIGDETRNDLYRVKYAIANNDSSAESALLRKLFKVNELNGHVETSSDASLTGSSATQLKDSTKQFRVSASAPNQTSLYSRVFVYFGLCDGKVTHTADFDTLKRQFFVKCAVQGDIIGQLPRGTKEQKFTSFVIYPSENEFSVTADGQIRLFNVNVQKRQNYTVSVSATTPDGQVTVYTISIDVQPCDLFDVPPQPVTSLPSLPNFGTIPFTCPQANEIIADLSKIPLFVKELSSYNRSNGVLATSTLYFGTNASNLVQITPDKRLFWMYTPGDTIPSLSITITVQAAGAKHPVKLGLITLVRQKSTTKSPQQQTRHTRLAQPKCNSDQKQNKFTQTINVQCALAGEYIAYVSTLFLLPLIQQTSLFFRLGESDYFGIEPRSGLVFVKKSIARDMELGLALPVSVYGSPTFDAVLLAEKLLYEGLLNVRISCQGDPSGAAYDASGSNPFITCEQFEFGNSTLPIGVIKSEGQELVNRDFVAQVFADFTGYDGLNNSVPRYRWSVNDETASGYKIDPYTGNIFQTSSQPKSTLTVRATSVARSDVWCESQLQPKLVDNQQFAQAKALGLLNRQPPRFSTSFISFTHMTQACDRVQGKLVFNITTGFNLGRLDAFDPDDGLAGDVTYALCPTGNSAAGKSCGEMLNVNVPAGSTPDGTVQQLQLHIDPRTGNLFVARQLAVKGHASLPLFHVQASNALPMNASEPSASADFTGVPARQSFDTVEVSLNFACAVKEAA